MQKKIYSADTKLKAVLRLLNGEASGVELAKEIGCHPTVLGMWKEQFLKSAPHVFESQKAADDKDKKIQDLEQIIGRLTVQNEFLKKGSGTFSSP